MWYDIIIMNLVFWPLWIVISMLPQNIMRYIIENHEIFFEKNEKSS